MAGRGGGRRAPRSLLRAEYRALQQQVTPAVPRALAFRLAHADEQRVRRAAGASRRCTARGWRRLGVRAMVSRVQPEINKDGRGARGVESRSETTAAWTAIERGRTRLLTPGGRPTRPTFENQLERNRDKAIHRSPDKITLARLSGAWRWPGLPGQSWSCKPRPMRSDRG